MSAKADIRIELDVKEDSLSALPIFEKIKTFVKKANTGKLGGDFDLYVIEDDGGSIFLEAHSSREQNLEWQPDKLFEFCEAIPEVKIIDADTWIAAEGRYFERE